TLVKCSTYPNDAKDKGKHIMTYSLMSHSGGSDCNEVVRQAYALNDPLILIKSAYNTISEGFSLVDCDANNVIVDAVKPAEDGKGVIIRLHENSNCRTDCTLSFGIKAKDVYFADMLENKSERLDFSDGKIKFRIMPYEIITLYLETQR
ncbi:MAG: alpha-mannosidase, partial [Clostridia bacterium]|nr:alpha-mannosidase [Clostridia bacterium]